MRSLPWTPAVDDDGGMLKRAHVLTLLVLALLVGATFHVGASRAEDDPESVTRPKALRGLSGAAAMEHVVALTDDKMLGRKTGFEGGAIVEGWVATQMAEYGLDPVDHGGTYLEPFRFTAGHVEGPIEVRVGTDALAYAVDYFDLIYTGTGEVEAEVVFVGYGIHRPDLAWDDYADLDVKGKIVLAMRGAPPGRASEFNTERMIGYKSSTAAAKGAVGFMLAEGGKASTGTIQARFHQATLPAVWVSGAVALKFLSTKGRALSDERVAEAPGRGFATGVRARLQVKGRAVENALGQNAMGAIKGRDPDLKGEVIVIGAHMDHLGVGPDGQVFNGADDNASGTAVLLHLADILTRNRWKPKRTIVFVAFGAEEQGLHGSKALAATGMPFANQGIACLLNLDMVGQGKPVVRVVGTSAFPTTAARIKAAIPDRLAKSIEFARVTGSFGDHWPFWERGIPAFFVATAGKHPNYHTPLDDVERIEPALLERTADVIGHILLALGEHPEPLLEGRSSLTDFLLREGPRFAHHPAGEPLPEGRALVDAGVGALIVDVPCPTLEAGKAALLALVPDDRGDLLRARGAADVRRAWREGRLAIIPRALCGAVMAQAPVGDAGEVGAAVALRKSGAVILAPFLAEAGRADPAKIAGVCAPAGVLLDLAGLDAAGLAAAYGACEGQRCVHVAPWAAEAAAALIRLPKDAAVLRLWTPTLDAQVTTKFDLEQDVVLMLADTAALTPWLEAWGNLRSDMWWKPESKVRKRLRATFGGRMMKWLRGMK